jgi:hypothetical protein
MAVETPPAGVTWKASIQCASAARSAPIAASSARPFRGSVVLCQRHQPVVRHLQERLGPELGDDERAQARHAREDRQDRIGQHDRRRVRHGPVDENAALAVQDAERREERRRGGVLGRDRRRRDRAVQPFTCRSAGSSSSLMSRMLASA